MRFLAPSSISDVLYYRSTHVYTNAWSGIHRLFLVGNWAFPCYWRPSEYQGCGTSHSSPPPPFFVVCLAVNPKHEAATSEIRRACSSTNICTETSCPVSTIKPNRTLRSWVLTSLGDHIMHAVKYVCSLALHPFSGSEVRQAPRIFVEWPKRYHISSATWTTTTWSLALGRTSYRPRQGHQGTNKGSDVIAHIKHVKVSGHLNQADMSSILGDMTYR